MLQNLAFRIAVQINPRRGPNSRKPPVIAHISIALRAWSRQHATQIMATHLHSAVC
jgi:hypothetical protein